jgi:SAM-dependent methyltransferase
VNLELEVLGQASQGDSTVRIVLDLGCGSGAALPSLLSEFDVCVGIDPDSGALAAASRRGTGATLICAVGEKLPFRDSVFDHAYLCVSLPYMHCDRALAELARVLRPGASLRMSMHSWEFFRHALRDWILSGNIKGIAFAGYIAVNGIALHLGFPQFAYPLKPSRFESVQTERGILRLLRKHRFTDISFSRPDVRFYANAVCETSRF